MPDADDRLAQFDRIDADLEGVEQALVRLDAGTYASCEVCGEPLADGLLAEDPVRRRCPTHALA
jgi:RNA polymerase-binding transcription factor DksA